MDLDIEIRHLINSKREGEYWDFKEDPHDDNASLLHDILCLANCLHKSNRYLIFGVTDPSNGATIKGLNPNQKHRKSQVDIIDFLRNLHFAGDCRPEIELHTLIIDHKEIDVLIVFDNPTKPYYLTKDYVCKREGIKDKKVRANNIYTRTNDTNTPIDKSADIGIIEKMWKQRFGIDLSPLEKMQILLLSPQDWFKDIGNKSYAYHNLFPEFRIDFSDVEAFWEVYSFFYTNTKSYLGNASFKYHSTTLFELQYIYVDEMRRVLAAPETEYLLINKKENWYYYYDLENLIGKFLFFLTDGLFRLGSRGNYSPFIIFKNEKQRKDFNEYLQDNEPVIKRIKPSIHADLAKKEIATHNLNPPVDVIFMDKIQQLFSTWTSKIV